MPPPLIQAFLLPETVLILLNSSWLMGLVDKDLCLYFVLQAFTSFRRISSACCHKIFLFPKFLSHACTQILIKSLFVLNLNKSFYHLYGDRFNLYFLFFVLCIFIQFLFNAGQSNCQALSGA